MFSLGVKFTVSPRERDLSPNPADPPKLSPSLALTSFSFGSSRAAISLLISALRAQSIKLPEKNLHAWKFFP